MGFLDVIDENAPKQKQKKSFMDVIDENAPKVGPSYDDEKRKMISEMSPTEKFLVGAGKGLLDISGGIKQRALQAGVGLNLLGEKTLKDYESGREEELRNFDLLREESSAAAIGELTGQAAPLALLPGGVSGGFIKRAATSALSGGTASGLTYTREGEDTAGKIGTGAAFGAGGSLGVSAAGKAYNVVKGKIADPIKREIIDLAKRYDIPLTIGEITESPIVKKLETLLEDVPFIGTGRFRLKQAGKVEDAASGITGKYFSKAGKPEDAQLAMQTSLLRQLGEGKKITESAYKNVSDIVSRSPRNLITPDETKLAAVTLIKEYPDLFKRLVDESTEKKIRIIAGDLADEIIQPKILLPSGKPQEPIRKAVQLSFDEMVDLEKKLGQLIGRAKQKTGVGEVGSEEVRALSQVYSAVEKDIDNWGENNINKNIATAYSHAKDIYKTKVLPFKDALINRATGDDYDTDLILQTFIKPERAALANKLVANLDIEGREAVKYAVLRNAYDKAVLNKETFSSQTFASTIEKLGKVNNIVFKKGEKEELMGLVQIMHAAKRAGQYLENPPTGIRAAQLVSFGLLTGGGVLAVTNPEYIKKEAAFASGVMLFTYLTTTKGGRNLLLSASKVEADSPALQKIISQAYNQIPKISALAGSDQKEDIKKGR